MKKKIPLLVHEFIEPFLDRKGKNFLNIDPDKFMIRFIDKDPGSDFYFNVEEFRLDKGFQLLIDWKPLDKQNVANKRMWIAASALDQFLSKWLELLDGYDKVKTVFDDPIVESYSEDFFSEFELIDEDEEQPVTIKQALLIDEHLDSITNRIDTFINDKNELQIIEIKKDIQDLKENLTTQSKKTILKSLTRIWGKIAKQGIPLIKEFLTEAKKQIIKQSVSILLEKGGDII
ncbi:hypothetical protein [Fluviicola taffensis]|uniref:Uncharacterized protein n=1 Tax=Fluviicola taffensis (strain DSM 16823 / NCIMB 13979 / RW262) TaxID=755732 RepID=F2IK69_FLUTR|nr:hypothetical protein [Fluviicola taffensis]AEA42968.1 hypothetical protein Fluta_0967 [Fluviicola taffensis DSM 16823]